MIHIYEGVPPCDKYSKYIYYYGRHNLIFLIDKYDKEFVSKLLILDNNCKNIINDKYHGESILMTFLRHNKIIMANSLLKLLDDYNTVDRMLYLRYEYDGYNSINYSIIYNIPYITKILKDYGVKPNCKSLMRRGIELDKILEHIDFKDCGRIIIMESINQNNTHIIQYFLRSKLLLTLDDKTLKNCIKHAVFSNKILIVNILLDDITFSKTININSDNLLEHSILNNYFEMAQLLVDNGAFTNVIDSNLQREFCNKHTKNRKKLLGNLKQFLQYVNNIILIECSINNYYKLNIKYNKKTYHKIFMLLLMHKKGYILLPFDVINHHIIYHIITIM